MNTQHQYIEFKQTGAGGTTSRRTGIRIGEMLAITYPDKMDQSNIQIFSVLTGKPVTKVLFQANDKGIDDAITIAKWLDSVYHEYWDIWYVYPEWDIISIARWTVANGLLIFLSLDKLQNRVISLDDIRRVWQQSKQEIKSWTRENEHTTRCSRKDARF